MTNTIDWADLLAVSVMAKVGAPTMVREDPDRAIRAVLMNLGVLDKRSRASSPIVAQARREHRMVAHGLRDAWAQALKAADRAIAHEQEGITGQTAYTLRIARLVVMELLD